jgi:hypothetical protein
VRGRYSTHVDWTFQGTLFNGKGFAPFDLWALFLWAGLRGPLKTTASRQVGVCTPVAVGSQLLCRSGYRTFVPQVNDRELP